MDQPLVIKVVDWCLSGISRLDIREKIRDLDPFVILTNADCDTIIADAKRLLEEMVSNDNSQTLSVHIGLYEEIYQYYNSIRNIEGGNKAMKAKERLLGISGGSRTVVNGITNININKQVKYNTGQLSNDDQLKFNDLLRKCSLHPPLQILRTLEIRGIT